MLVYTRIRELKRTASVSRNLLSPVSFIQEHGFRNITLRIQSSLRDSNDQNERQEVENVLWKNWYPFIESIRTKKISNDFSEN